MTTPRRFTDCAHLCVEGRLLAAGRAEYPEQAALQRATLRLGLPAVALGAAAAALSVTSATATSTAASAGTATSAGIATSAATTTSASAAIVSASTMLPGATSAMLTATFLKATVIGLAIGAGTIGTADLALRSTASKPAAIAHTTRPHTSSRAQASRQAQPRQPLTATPRSTGSAELVVPNQSPAVRAASTSRPRQSGLSDVGTQSAKVLPSPTAKDAVVVPTADFDQQPHSLASSPTSKTHLASEVESLDRARAAASRGDAAGALRELDDFASHQPYRLLAGEVMLVRIDALLALGNSNEAATLARQLLLLGAPAPQRTRLERLARMK